LVRERQAYEDKEGPLADRGDSTVLAAETLRNGSEHRAGAASPKGEERMSVFWRVFGGTLLSIAALVVITVYNQFNTTLTDLRKELNQLYENRAELLRKDEFSNRLNSVWNSLKELQGANQKLAALNERAKLLDQQLERQTKNADDDRKDLCRRLDEQRKAGEAERQEMQRKLEDQRKLAEAERGEHARQLQEQRRTAAEERKELLAKLEEQRKVFSEDHKETARQLRQLGERLATVEARKAGKAGAAAAKE
jgi:chromosome segregation ATPase